MIDLTSGTIASGQLPQFLPTLTQALPESRFPSVNAVINVTKGNRQR